MSAVLDTFLRVLNEAVAADRRAIQDLIDTRTQCGQALADHPTIQVIDLGSHPLQYLVGTLGLINGLVEAATGERIAACYDEAGQLTGFIRYEGPT